jgi:hypothetical protein
MKGGTLPRRLLQAAALARIDELGRVMHMPNDRTPDPTMAPLSSRLSEHPDGGVAEFTGPQGHRTAWFKDSEGNVLAVGSY